MKHQIAVARIGKVTHPLEPGADTRLVGGFSGWLSQALDRFLLGMAVMGPPESPVLDMQYAEAMVQIYDEWFALHGLRGSTGGNR